MADDAAEWGEIEEGERSERSAGSEVLVSVECWTKSAGEERW
jgi:hypothetical protein